MRYCLSHATPAKLIFAFNALHITATTIFSNVNPTFRTLLTKDEVVYFGKNIQISSAAFCYWLFHILKECQLSWNPPSLGANFTLEVLSASPLLYEACIWAFRPRAFSYISRISNTYIEKLIRDWFNSLSLLLIRNSWMHFNIYFPYQLIIIHSGCTIVIETLYFEYFCAHSRVKNWINPV